MHEGNENQGKYGKQGWSIARRLIAVAMGEPDGGKDPVGLFPGERVAHRRVTLDQPARQESLAQVKGGSIKIGSQIFADFVQIRTVYMKYDGFRAYPFEFVDKIQLRSSPSCNMRANRLTTASPHWEQLDAPPRSGVRLSRSRITASIARMIASCASRCPR